MIPAEVGKSVLLDFSFCLVCLVRALSIHYLLPLVVPWNSIGVYDAESRNVMIRKAIQGYLIVMSVAAPCTRRSKLQHNVAQGGREAQERATNGFTDRAAGIVTVGGAGRFGSTASTGRDHGTGGMGGWERGRNDRGSGGDGNSGGSFFDLVIDSSDERSQVGVLHIVGEDEWDNSWGRAREVLRRGEAASLCIDDDGVPTSASEGETRKVDCANALTCGVRNQQEGRVRRIQ